MATRNIELYDPTKGIFTNVDQDDMTPGFASELDNFYLDKPGKLYKREGALYLDEINSFNALRSLFKMVDADHANGAQWIAFDKESDSSVKIWYSDDAATWTSLLDSAVAVASVDEMTAFRVFQILRMAISPSFPPQHYQYYKRKFFADGYDHSDGSPVWAIKTAALVAPADHVTFANTSQLTYGGSNEAGYYMYKITAVYDGNQESLLSAGGWQVHVQVTTGIRGVILTLTVDETDAEWSPRVLFYKLYRSFDTDGYAEEDGFFQLIDTISTQNLFAKAILTLDRTMEKRFHDKESPWGANNMSPTGTDPLNSPSNGDTKHRIRIISDGNRYDIVSNTTTLITTNDDIQAGDAAYFAEPYDLEIWTYVISVWAYTSTPYSGTEGYGGEKCFHELNAAWKVNEHLHKVINFESSRVGLILGNDDECIAHNSAVTQDTGILSIFSKHLWKGSTGAYTLYVIDSGLLDKGPHPLAGITSITVNYRYAVYFMGRNWVGDVAIDPDGDNELHPDWVMYSEIDQLDVIANKNYLPPLTKRGGKLLGIEILEKASSLVFFYRNVIGLLSAPRADPQYWDNTLATEGMGVFNQASYASTPYGIIFASDSGLYLLDSAGNLIDTPLSGPIEDEWLTAAGNASAETNFSVMYMPAKRLVYVKMSSSQTQIHVLTLKSILGDYPKWNKMQLGSISSSQVNMARGFVDEANKFFFHGWELDPIYTIGSGQTGTESFSTKFKSAYFRLGNMIKDHLVRYLYLAHKGDQAITPTLFLNDGATSVAGSSISAAATGEHKTVKFKRRGRNAAIQLASAASTSIDLEIRGLEMEVEIL